MWEFLQLGMHLLDVRVVVNVDEWVGVGNHPAFLAEPWQIAQGFHRLARQDNIGFAFRDDIGEDRLA